MKKKRTPSLMVITLPNLWMYAIVAAMIALLLLVGNLAQREEAQTVFSPALFGVSIVIDAGHGGYDPGMVGGKQCGKRNQPRCGLGFGGILPCRWRQCGFDPGERPGLRRYETG